MQHYKWYAYDTSGTEHRGVFEASRWEEVAIHLESRRLLPSSIIKVEYDEYAKLYAATNRIEKLEKFKNLLSGKHENIGTNYKRSGIPLKIMILVAVMLLFAAVLWWAFVGI